MIFNSIEFLIFGLLFFALWPLMRAKDTPRWMFIVLSSFIFYGWWDWRFLFLIIFSGLVDYSAGLLMTKLERRRKLILLFSIIVNLGSLFIFKYSTFVATVIQDVCALFDLKVDMISRIPEFALILPVGISFYTFQSLSYTIDVYRNRLEPTRNILHFFAFLAMFPQLVAGPIVRAKDFLFQLSRYRIPSRIEKWNAVKMIAYGLFQKMVIADNLSYFIDSAWEGATVYAGSVYWWAVAIAFSVQIYADFSGYSLIARGLAKFMGYHFKMNFNHPYLATSMRQFWTRWHISLSTWFRDYVYIPMGGSKNGAILGILALCATMMLSGIWHGANYTFLVWAALHSVFLIVERLTKYTKVLKRTPFVLIGLVSFQATIAWVYFRAPTIDQAHEVMTYLFNFSSSDIRFVNLYFNNLVFLVLAVLIETFVYLRKQKGKLFRLYRKNQVNYDTLIMAICIIMIVFFRGEGKQFIYFQF